MLYCVFHSFVLLHKSSIFVVFIHIFLCISGEFAILFVSSFVSQTVRPLNQTSSEPSETQREDGWEIVSRLLGKDRISQSSSRKYNGNCILKSCRPRKKIKKYSSPREGRKTALARMIWDTPTSNFGSWHTPNRTISRRQPGKDFPLILSLGFAGHPW